MKRFHYAWIVVAVTFFALLAAQAVRAAPGVIITSLESEFGWSRTAISLAISLSLLTFGLGGPLDGTLIDRFGPRLVMLAGDLLIVGGLRGAAIAAFAGGFFRDLLGDYHLMFISAGILGFVAVSLALRISTSAITRMPTPVLEAARP